MTKNNPFDYFVGINSLEEIATKDSKVVVMNILGNESRNVTPVSHEYSGGNIVAGVQYGRKGKLETKIGKIPVYGRLAEVVENHEFDTGVIYLPPDAVFHAVTELCHYNAEKLKKIIIITEKLSVKDQRLIRAIAQANEIDVFGANCLGVADSWNHIRIGGALGGDRPEETLIKGSIAIHSNSGNFSTTIAEYLKTSGFGTSTIISSGKDVIIQFAVPEFLYAAENDPRTKAAVLYVEPGGYYEQQALDMIKEGKFSFNKPIIACVTGRWKSNLTRACGHAGALAGEGDDAIAKEKWFDDYFGVPVFNPDEPENVSEKGVRVASIQHIPLAVKAVFNKIGIKPDFEPIGNLGLKPWFGNNFDLKLPLHLQIPVVEALPPYNKEIEEINKQVGATFLRENMRNKSGASRINPSTFVAELHGIPVVELIEFPYESNIFFSLTKLQPEKDKLKLANIILNYFAKPTEQELHAVQTAKNNGATPNESLIAALALNDGINKLDQIKIYTDKLITLFSEIQLRDLYSEIDYEKTETTAKKMFETGSGEKSELADFLSAVIKNCFKKTNIVDFAFRFNSNNKVKHPEAFLFAALLLEFSYKSLVLKKITRQTAVELIEYISIIAKSAVLNSGFLFSNSFLKNLFENRNFDLLENSFTETVYQALFNEKPTEESLIEFYALLALTLTNGPGTLSAKGAKESVSARNNISTAFTGYLSNTGLAHGGSGYEAIQFLIDSFESVKIKDPSQPDEKIDLKNISHKVAVDYLEYKNTAKLKGELNYKRIPCINHPVFKGKRVNIDPREDFIRKYLKSKNINNLFWDFYHELVEELYKVGVSNNVYCVNIDAVIAVISLKLMWKPYTKKKLSENDLQNIGFIIFLLGRTAGVSAEIIDHRARGTDMDCRTPQSETAFIS